MNNTMPVAHVPTSTKQQAEDLYRLMEETLAANPSGGSHPEVLREIQRLALSQLSSCFLKTVAELLKNPASWDQD